MIATSGLHDSFSRIKKSVCYSSCALERRKFQKMHRIRINSERPRYRGRHLSFISAFPTAATRTGFVHVLYP